MRLRAASLPRAPARDHSFPSDAAPRRSSQRAALRRRGLLITFEGVEGSGKSLQLRRLGRLLRARRVPIVVTREPGGTPAGEAIRRIFLGPRGKGLDPWAELFLVEAARAQHLATVIRPAILSGRHVLCDRFTDSTLAYQGYGRGLPLEVIRTLHALRGLAPAPDLTLIFDLPVGVGLARARGRNAGSPARRREGRLDAERAAFHETVRRGFLEIAAEDPRRTIVVPAQGVPEEIARLVRAAVLPRLGLEPE